jgi:hypothetical protein
VNAQRIADHVDPPARSTFELAREAYQLATEAVDVPSDPEAEAAFGARLRAWVGESADKGEACAYAYRAQVTAAQHWRAEADRFMERAKRADRAAESILDHATSLVLAAEALADQPGVKVGPLKMQNNPPSVVIDDEAAIPEPMWTVKVVRSVNKTIVGAALKAGQQVAGARLEVRRRLVGLG